MRRPVLLAAVGSAVLMGATLGVVAAPAPAEASTYFRTVSGVTLGACETARKAVIADVRSKGYRVYHSAPCAYQSSYPYWRGRVYWTTLP